MIVLDASALLALLQQERGADVVRDALRDAVMSVANLAEVLGRSADRGLDVAHQRRLIESLGIRFEPVLGEDAETSAKLRAQDAAAGTPVLSLGDRLCLALAARLELPVLTADRAWSDVDHGVEVRLLR